MQNASSDVAGSTFTCKRAHQCTTHPLVSDSHMLLWGHTHCRYMLPLCNHFVTFLWPCYNFYVTFLWLLYELFKIYTLLWDLVASTVIYTINECCIHVLSQICICQLLAVKSSYYHSIWLVYDLYIAVYIWAELDGARDEWSGDKHCIRRTDKGVHRDSQRGTT